MKIKTIFTIILLLSTIQIANAFNFKTNYFIETNHKKLDNVRILDGYTVEASIYDNTFKIRLVGIDCYESYKNLHAYKQAYDNNITVENVIERGKKAKKTANEFLSVHKNNMTLDFYGIDKYGRVLGILYGDDIDFNEHMRKTGYFHSNYYIETKK